MEDDVKRFMMALVVAVLAIAGAQVSAKAATIPLGDITNSSNDAFGGSLSFFTPAAVSDDITFTLTAPSFVSGNLVNLPFNVTLPPFGSFAILDITGLNATFLSNPLTLDGSGNFSIAGMLAAGNYLIHVGGTTAGVLGGVYHISVAATTTPIPGALLLFITALGTAGFVGWRRRGSAAA
jgi:hypothetical protein